MKTSFPGGSSGGGGNATAGKNTWLPVTVSRNYDPVTDLGKTLYPSPATSNFTITVVPGAQVVGDAFGIGMPGTGKLTVVGSGVTVNDVNSRMSTQITNDIQLACEFFSPTVLNVG